MGQVMEVGMMKWLVPRLWGPEFLNIFHLFLPSGPLGALFLGLRRTVFSTVVPPVLLHVSSILAEHHPQAQPLWSKKMGDGPSPLSQQAS